MKWNFCFDDINTKLYLLYFCMEKNKYFRIWVNQPWTILCFTIIQFSSEMKIGKVSSSFEQSSSLLFNCWVGLNYTMKLSIRHGKRPQSRIRTGKYLFSLRHCRCCRNFRFKFWLTNFWSRLYFQLSSFGIDIQFTWNKFEKEPRIQIWLYVL